VFENYVTNRQFEGKIVEIALWDTAGQEEYDRLRPLSYPESHVILIVFSIDFPVSLANVQDKVRPAQSRIPPLFYEILSIACKETLSLMLRVVARFLQWYPEVAHFCEGTPLILVATKTDLRRDDTTRRMLTAQGQTPVTSEQGAEVAREIGAKYVECSAKTGSGVQEVFALALRESMRGKWGKIARPRRCVVT
jgi:Rho family protein